MNKNIDLDNIRNKALDLVELEDEKDFIDFYGKQYEDIIENTDDYIAAEVANQFYLNKDTEE